MTPRLINKFHSLYEPVTESGCWIWMGQLRKKGYGRFRLNELKEWQAHRFSWEIHFGEIPPGLMVCHKCDTPACVNPSHLFVGTNSDNMADMKRKRRVRHGSRHPKAKLTEEQVIEIRQSKDSTQELAERYGVSYTSIFGIIKGITWK